MANIKKVGISRVRELKEGELICCEYCGEIETTKMIQSYTRKVTCQEDEEIIELHYIDQEVCVKCGDKAELSIWNDGTDEEVDGDVYLYEEVEGDKSLCEIQSIHFNWLKSVGWAHKNTPLEGLMLVVSECGEAANELRGEEPTENLPLELADIILRTMGIASEQGINLEQAILTKIEMNKQRGTKGRVK